MYVPDKPAGPVQKLGCSHGVIRLAAAAIKTELRMQSEQNYQL